MDRRPLVKWIICQYYAVLLIHEMEDFVLFCIYFLHK